ncbi:MAG: hypothetical protein N2112_08630 [Gemmataceae bacterium]|jgi:hypothetical protein|nr:hypothetical protein [Gemmataceae bacterium]
MNKTKLAALGMLTSLICILSVGTHEIWGTDPSQTQKSCPDTVQAETDCPINGLPFCDPDAPEEMCTGVGGISVKGPFIGVPLPPLNPLKKEGYKMGSLTQINCYYVGKCVFSVHEKGMPAKCQSVKSGVILKHYGIPPENCP